MREEVGVRRLHEEQLLLQPVLLHQTMPTLNLTAGELAWQSTWTALGFQVRLADNARCRQDIAALADATGERADSARSEKRGETNESGE